MRRWKWLLITAVMLAVGIGSLWLPWQSFTSPVSEANPGMVLIDSEYGPYVLAVQENSPASRAGIMPGDVLDSINGTPVSLVSEAEASLLSANAPGFFTVRRNGHSITFNLKETCNSASKKVYLEKETPSPQAGKNDEQ